MTGEHYDENTLFKVRTVLMRCGLGDVEITDAISAMQNEGILFRERAPEPAPAPEGGPDYPAADQPHTFAPHWSHHCIATVMRNGEVETCGETLGGGRGKRLHQQVTADPAPTGARPKLQIVDDGQDGMDRGVWLNGRCVATLLYNIGGHKALEEAVEAVKATALALGADVEDTDDPERQPYRYFVSYFFAGRHGHPDGFGHTWRDCSEAVEGPDGTAELMAAIKADNPEMATVVILNLQLVDGPM